MLKKNIRFFIMACILIVSGYLLTGCWDEVVHIYDDNSDCADTASQSSQIIETATAKNTDSGTNTDADSGSESVGTGSETAFDGVINSLLPADWKGFGQACETTAECKDYPLAEKRCSHDTLGIINSPLGYCSACCDKPGKDVCGPGVDCVGTDGVFLICIARCKSNSDCRTDDHYECRSMPYIPKEFPDKYCLPDEQHIMPDTSAHYPAIECPWHWIDTETN
jgi:hypothetical protein